MRALKNTLFFLKLLHLYSTSIGDYKISNYETSVNMWALVGNRSNATASIAPISIWPAGKLGNTCHLIANRIYWFTNFMSLSEILFDTLKDDEQKVRRLIKANFKI